MSSSHIPESPVCPFTGLKINFLPEWSDIPLSDSYTISYGLIGEAIIHLAPAGSVSSAAILKSLEVRKEFLKETGLIDKQYAEIRDYSKINGHPSKNSRILLTESLLKEHNANHLLGIWNYNLPPHIAMLFNVGKTIFKKKKFIHNVKDYGEAIKSAVRMVEQHTPSILSPQEPLVRTESNLISSSQLQTYTEDLIRFIGQISWDKRGDIPEKTDDSHPFKSLYEAVHIIKTDVDHLFEKQKRNKIKLIDSEKRYRSILESIDDGYYEVDLKGNFTFFNSALCRICGYPEDELLGMSYKKLADTENKERIFKLFNAVYREEKPADKSFEWEFYNKQGEKVYLESSVSLIRDNKNEITGFRGIIRDISERIESERKQRESKEELELLNIQLEKAIERTNLMVAESAMAYLELDQIFKASTEGIWVISSSFDILRVNDTLLNIVGMTQDEISGKKCFDVMPSRLCHTSECPLTRIMEMENGIASLEFEMEFGLNEGSVKPYIFSAFPFKDTIDETIGVVIGLRDISERIKAEKLHAEKIKAESENVAKSNFLANVSHEIRTPLNGIIGMTELLENTKLDQSQLQFFNTIASEAKSLLNIISDVLDFSKIEAGKFGLEQRKFSFSLLFDDIVENLAIRAHQKGLDFLAFSPPEIPEELLGDAGKIRQIFMNLGGNALKFTHTGEIEFTVESEKIDNEKYRLHCAVRDTGIGIPKESHEKIFECFTQADDSTTRKYGGTGLGTAIAKQLVELMNGTITVESSPGEGSIFSFTIDVEDASVSPPPEPLPLGVKCLVANRHPGKLNTCNRYLSHMGVDTISVLSGEAVLEYCIDSSEEKPDLILAGNDLPDMSGFELADKIRSLGTPPIPVILITPIGWAGDRKICIDSAIEGCINGPVSYRQLKKEIDQVRNLHLAEELDLQIEIKPPHSPVAAAENISILLVEDYPTNQQVALTHLTEFGYQVDIAANGRDAVTMFDNNSYQLILMDIQMPIMGGFEATEQIRQIEAGRPAPSERVPIIAMTAHAMEGYRKVCLDAGMDDYITKPLIRKALLGIVEKWTTAPLLPEFEAGPETIEKDPVAETSLPIDYDRALEEFVGKKDILTKVLSVFIENVKNQIPEMRKAIQGNQPEILKAEAHTLKGGAANLTAFRLSEIAYELETIGASGNPQGAGPVLDRFEEEFLRLEAYLTKLD